MIPSHVATISSSSSCPAVLNDSGTGGGAAVLSIDSRISHTSVRDTQYPLSTLPNDSYGGIEMCQPVRDARTIGRKNRRAGRLVCSPPSAPRQSEHIWVSKEEVDVIGMEARRNMTAQTTEMLRYKGGCDRYVG
jgi:hypothetical protein